MPQPFFVLHQATTRCKSTVKIRRRIDLSSKPSDADEKDAAEGYDDNARLKNFQFLWSKIESTITDVLRNINAGVFEKIDEWVRKSFDAIRGCWFDPISTIQKDIHYPVLNSLSLDPAVAPRKLFTALVFTKNMEFVDDIITFVDLGVHLRTGGCHVANLTSLDFSAKNGAPDISAITSWYTESENAGNPVFVIIDKVERCSDSVLADFIILLSEWVIKIPTILIVEVATNVDVLRNTLSSNAYSRISCREFTLGTPAERMDAIIEAVLLKHSGSFSVGKQVMSFLRSYFLHHDGTLNLFVRALKISMAQQLYAEHLSFLFTKIADEDTKCLYEVGKCQKIILLDLYCEILERELHNSEASDQFRLAKDNHHPSHNEHLLACLQKRGGVNRIIQIVRDLSCAEMAKLLRSWEIITRGNIWLKNMAIINNHEWFAIVYPPCSQAKKRLKSSSKEPERQNDASIQAEFCRAVNELQITGLLRLPSKRRPRPDYVQRVALGL